MSTKRFIINAFIALNWVVNDEGPPSLPLVDCATGDAAMALDDLVEALANPPTFPTADPVTVDTLHRTTTSLIKSFNEAVPACSAAIAFLEGVGEGPEPLRGELLLADCVAVHRDIIGTQCAFPPSLHTLGVLAETASQSVRVQLVDGQPDETLRDAAHAAFLGAERAQRQLRLAASGANPDTPVGKLLSLLAPPASFISRAAASSLMARATQSPPADTWGDRHFFRATYDGLADYAGTDDVLAGEARILLAQAATAFDGPTMSLRVLAGDPTLRVATVWAAACSVARQLTRGPDALVACQRAAVLDPTTASHRLALADLQRSSAFPSLFNLTASLEQLMVARSLDPLSPSILYSLAATHSLAGHLEEAVTLWRETERLAGETAPDVRFLSLSERAQVQARMADWSTREEDLGLLRAQALRAIEVGVAPVVTPWAALGFENFDAPLIRRIATEHMRATIASTVGEPIFPPLPVDETRVERGETLAALDDPTVIVRVGFVTADLGNTNVGHDLLGFFHAQRASHRLVEVYVYTPTPDDGTVWRTELVRALGVDRLRYIGGSSSIEAASLIRADRIDVLINLNGFVKYSRNDIFVLRPAPVQVVYKGYPGTMGGLGVHDYILGDATVTPLATASAEFGERVVQLPHSFFLTSYPAVFGHIPPAPPTTPSLPASPSLSPSLSCEEGGAESCPSVVLCDFNHLYKVTPATFAAWRAILEAVPTATLWLLRLPPQAEAHLLSLSPASLRRRLFFSSLYPLSSHLHSKQRCDLFLDTFTFNAHGTALDALWAGIPLLTLRGHSYQSRAASSHLLSLSLGDELIATSVDDFIRRAVSLSLSPPRLASLRERVREATRSSSRLFNTAAWTDDFEKAMRALATVRRTGQSAAHLIMGREREREREGEEEGEGERERGREEEWTGPTIEDQVREGEALRARLWGDVVHLPPHE
jgi:hypothetical protein